MKATREEIIECEIKACGMAMLKKLDKFPVHFTDEQRDFVRNLCEMAYIEGRDAGLERGKEIYASLTKEVDLLVQEIKLR